MFSLAAFKFAPDKRLALNPTINYTGITELGAKTWLSLQPFVGSIRALCSDGEETMSKDQEEFRVENGVLYIHLSGKFPKELFDRKENLFQPLIDACSTHQCTRALVDARDVQLDFDIRALFRAGEDCRILEP